MALIDGFFRWLFGGGWVLIVAGCALYALSALGGQPEHAHKATRYHDGWRM